jgi:serine protease AprX
MAKPKKAATPQRLRVMVEVTVERDAPRERVYQTAAQLASAGLDLDRDYGPVRLRPPEPERERLASAGRQLMLVRGTIDATRKPELEKHPAAYRVWIDTPLQPFTRSVRPAAARHTARRRAEKSRPKSRPARARATAAAGAGFSGLVNCGGGMVGTISTALTALGVTKIWKRGYRGGGVQVAVVDGGITAIGRPINPGEIARIDRVVDGWPTATWGTTALGWGPNNAQHGNMVAYDILAIAPHAHLWDIRIWQDMPGSTPGEKFAVYVSNAIAGYEFCIDRFTVNGIPQIITNSWGLYDSSFDAQFTSDPRSPFALMVQHALDVGMLLLFAGGNCGTGCVHPSTSPCGAADRGPNHSILGPNGHPDVMTVGGADTNGRWYGFTSQGAAVLIPNAPKPDFCSMMQFGGYNPVLGPKLFDGGTSTACATAAGVVALLKSYRPALTQAQAKTALMNTARNIRAPGFDQDSGAGIIRAYLALGAL